MTSPVCTVADGAGAPQSTTGGVNVTAGNTITIALASTAGVGVWSIAIVGQDELVTPPTLTVNNTNKTATFTAPAAPWSLIFKSTVNNGVDVNSQVQPSFSTTFKVSCLGSLATRLLASGEVLENDPNFGWTQIVNATLRSAGGITWANDLSGSSSTHQWVVSITGASGTGTSVTLGSSGVAFALSYAAGVTAPTISQAINTSGAGVNFGITAQAAKVGSAAAGGNLNLSGGAGDGAGANGNVSLFTGATEQWRATPTALVNVQANPIQFGTSTMPSAGLLRFAQAAGTLLGGNDTATTYSLVSWASGANLNLGASASFTQSVTSLSLCAASTGHVYTTLGTTTALDVNIAAGNANLTFFDINSAPKISQTASSGATVATTVTAQAAGGTNDGGAIVLNGGQHAGSSTVDGSVKVTTPFNAGYLTFSPSAGANTLTNAQSDANVILFGTQASAFTVNYLRRIADTSLLVVRNPSGNGTATIAYLTGGTVTVAAATSALIVSDGTNLQKIVVGT